MYKYILQSIENINWLSIAPLVLFFVFFVGITIWAITIKKTTIDRLGRLPLDED